MRITPAAACGRRLITRKLIIVVLLGSATLARAQVPVGKGGVEAAFAERDISPEIGQERAGGYGKEFHRSFRDSCKVRVGVFRQGATTVALVGVDALMLARPVVLAARAQIVQRTGIPGEAVLVSASHSHSSGPVGMVQPGEYDAAPELIRRLAYEESSLADAKYLERIIVAIVDGVVTAHAALAPAQLGFGVGHEEKVGFNRRMRMKNGQTWTNPGAGNPDIKGYAAPIDPDVGVIGAWDLSGRLVGVVVNHACHTNVLPEGISANWVCHLERVIQAAMESKVPVVFLPGACGDISKLDALSPYERPTEDAWMRVVGGRLGAEAVKVLLSAPRGRDIPLEARAKVWTIARRAPAAAKVQRAQQIVAVGKPKANPAITEWTFAKETLMADFLARTQPDVEVEVQAVQIGPAVCLTNPAEYFVEYGLELKRRSPFPFTFPVELANGCVGYVPTEEAFGANGGGYETRLTSYSNLAVSAGRELAEAGVALAAALQPGALPVPPRLAKPVPVWLYGNAPPEVD